MATKATIFKADLQIADIDRRYYQNHSLTIACHPSETNERMMMRLLAFIMYAHEHLIFGRSLSAQDEPDLWQKDLTGAIDLWIDIGQSDQRDIRRACSRAKQVVVICIGNRGTDLWWSEHHNQLERLKNLTIITIPAANAQALARLASRNMRLQCSLQESQISVISESDIVQIEPVVLLAPMPSSLSTR